MTLGTLFAFENLLDSVVHAMNFVQTLQMRSALEQLFLTISDLLMPLAPQTLFRFLVRCLRPFIIFQTHFRNDFILGSSQLCTTTSGSLHTKYCGVYLGILGADGSIAGVLNAVCGKAFE